MNNNADKRLVLTRGSPSPPSLPPRESAEDILDTAPCGFISTLPDGTITHVNATFLAWTGHSRASLLAGKRFQDLLTVPGRIFYETHFAPLLRIQGFVKEIACQLKREGHDPLQVLINSSLKLDADGQPLLIRTIVLDATDRTKYELELRRTRNEAQQLAAIVTSSGNAIVSLGLDLVVRTWNPGATLLFGYAEAEAAGRSIIELIVPDDKHDETVRIYETVRSGQNTIVRETVRRHKDGSLVPVEISVSPIRDGESRVSAISVVLRDISQRKAAEAALRQSEQLHRIAFDQAPIGMEYVGPDQRFMKVNARMCEISGYTEDELLRMKVSDLTHPDDVAGDTELLDAFFRGGTPYYQNEKRDVRKDGTIRWVAVTKRMVTDEVGRPLHSIGVIRDITDRKRAEAALRRSHDTYLSLIENNPFGVYLVDAAFRIAQVSVGARAVFSTVEPLLGRDFEEVVRQLWPDPFASDVIARFRHTLQTGEPYRSKDMSEPRADIDAVESYDWQIERVTLSDGRFGVVCYFYDMTERKRYEERIGLLMDEVSHRDKNLLAVVQAVVRQTVRSGDPATFEARLSERIAGLTAIHDLLINNQWRGIAVSDLVRGQLAHFNGLIDTRVLLDGPLARLSPAAAQGIGMALHELATNAGKYGALGDNEGRVRISWNIAGGPEPTFTMRWLEENGPDVVPPTRSGFGQIVMVRMVEHAVDGTVDLAYERTGLSWRLTAPLAGVQEESLNGR